MVSQKLLIFNICLILFVLLVLDYAECRGGRGGSRGGRFGTRSYRSRSYRSRSYRSRSYRARYNVARSKYSAYRLGSTRAKQVAITAGLVYGASRWRTRRTYISGARKWPEVCYNDMYEGNSTVKYYGRFVCPMYNQPDDYIYCCGDIGEQRCCEYFDTDSSQGSGRIAGTVIGVIIAVIAVAVLAYCCFKKRQKFAGKTLSTRTPGTHHFTDETAKPLQPMGYSEPPPPTTAAYGIQPTADMGPPQPPSYGDAMGTPYPQAGVPYPQDGAAYPPTGSPYPQPAPYPQTSYDDKPPVPSAEVSRGENLPYGLNPEANGSPYPPPAGSPYPPPGNAYPPPTAPYSSTGYPQ